MTQQEAAQAFIEKHPYVVQEAATRKFYARFSNLMCAAQTVKWWYRPYVPQGWEAPRPMVLRVVDQSLPPGQEKTYTLEDCKAILPKRIPRGEAA